MERLAGFDFFRGPRGNYDDGETHHSQGTQLRARRCCKALSRLLYNSFEKSVARMKINHEITRNKGN